MLRHKRMLCGRDTFESDKCMNETAVHVVKAGGGGILFLKSDYK